MFVAIYDVTMIWPHKLCLVVSYNPNIQPIYVEVFKKPNVDPEAAKTMFLTKWDRQYMIKALITLYIIN